MDSSLDTAADLDVLSATESNILPLELDNVSYEIDGMRLIKEMSLTLSAGSNTIILGPNGAGKSLLLRLCHGLLQPNDGTITWKGPARHEAGKYQAMVFQKPVMLRRSVAANLHFGLKSRGIEKNQRDRVVEEVLNATGLSRLAKTPARALSTGEQQRLAIARAWSLKPEVFFLDEPTANLDPAATHAIEEIISSIKKSGTTIVMSTHDLGQAKRLADKVLFLYRGRLLENAEATQFFEAPKNDLAQDFLKGELLWWHRQELKPPSQLKKRGSKRTQ
jgi:tungstate transport system ATP-binding protein